MTDLDDEDIRSKGGGAVISVRDPRVSRLIAWGMGVFGIALVGVGSWIATTLMSLRDSVTTIVSQNAAVIYRLDRNEQRDDGQDARLNQLDRDVSTLEGRNFRGGPVGR